MFQLQTLDDLYAAVEESEQVWMSRDFNRQQAAQLVEITDLVQTAAQLLDTRYPEAAVWRLIDAAGLLATLFPEAAAATGRGFRVAHREERDPARAPRNPRK